MEENEINRSLTGETVFNSNPFAGFEEASDANRRTYADTLGFSNPMELGTPATEYPRGMRWADMIDSDDENDTYEVLNKTWNEKLIPNVSRTAAGLLRVKLPEMLKEFPFLQSLVSAMNEHKIEIFWDRSINVQSLPDLLPALREDGERLGQYVDSLFQAIGVGDPQAKNMAEQRVLEGLYTLRELRAVMRNFHHTFKGSLDAKPPSVDWTMDLRLETLWEVIRLEERRFIHTMIDSSRIKERVKFSLENLFGSDAAKQLTDSYELALRCMVHNIYKACQSSRTATANKMEAWFNTHISKRMPSEWTLIGNGYQTVKQSLPLTHAEKVRKAETITNSRERDNFIKSKQTRVVQKKLLPIIDSSLLTSIRAKKVTTAWNNAFKTFQKETRETVIDPTQAVPVRDLARQVAEMRKHTIDVFTIFRRHSRFLRDEIFNKLRNDKTTNRRSSEQAVISAFEFTTELQSRSQGLAVTENNLIIEMCGYLPVFRPEEVDSENVSSLESRFVKFLIEKYRGLLYISGQ